LSFNCVSEKARKASRTAALPRSYWAWDEMPFQQQDRLFPYNPATNLLYGLRESLAMLEEEGLQNVFARHARHAESTRRAVRAWGLEILCASPEEYSNSLTAVMMPAGHDADALAQDHSRSLRHVARHRVGEARGEDIPNRTPRRFQRSDARRHLAGVEMGLALAGVPHRKGGVLAALRSALPRARGRPPQGRLNCLQHPRIHAGLFSEEDS